MESCGRQRSRHIFAQSLAAFKKRFGVLGFDEGDDPFLSISGETRLLDWWWVSSLESGFWDGGVHKIRNWFVSEINSWAVSHRSESVFVGDIWHADASEPQPEPFGKIDFMLCPLRIFQRKGFEQNHHRLVFEFLIEAALKIAARRDRKAV